MDLSLNEIQSLIQSTATEFMETEMPKSRVLEIDDSETGFDPEIWRTMCELGWAGMSIPEEYGGSGNSHTDLGALYEVMGYFACPSPHLSSAVLCANAILEAGSDDQKKALLPAIASGNLIYTLAFTEPEYGWDPEFVRLKASVSGGTVVLNGTKLFIPDANVADRILVAARSGDGADQSQGISLVAVDTRSPGVSIRVQTGWIGPKVCEVNFDNVEAPASDLLGPEGGAWPALETAMDRATAALCSFMSGGARRVTDMAREYSQTRVAFGVHIGTFQRVQDHVIDALNEADAAKWTAYEALWQLDEGDPNAPIGVSMAKSVASVGFPKACEASHHVHGGIGTDLEFGLTQYTKRARTLQHYLGDAIHHKRRMARLMAPA